MFAVVLGVALGAVAFAFRMAGEGQERMANLALLVACAACAVLAFDGVAYPE